MFYEYIEELTLFRMFTYEELVDFVALSAEIVQVKVPIIILRLTRKVAILIVLNESEEKEKCKTTTDFMLPSNILKPNFH